MGSARRRRLDEFAQNLQDIIAKGSYELDQV